MSLNNESHVQQYADYLRGCSRTPSSITSVPPTDDHQHRLTNPYHRLVALVFLRRIVDSLIITNQGRQNFALHEQMVEMRERFRQRRSGKSVFDERTLEPAQATVRRMLVVKLEDDIDILQSMCRKTVDELATDGSFSYLSGTIEQFRSEYRNEYFLICCHIRSGKELVQLQNQQAVDADSDRRLQQEANDEIGALKADIDAAVVENHVKQELVSKWENSRLEQAQRIMRQDESKLKQSIADYARKGDREKIAMEEIKNCNEYQIKQFAASCDAWQQRHATDTQHFDAQIADINAQIADIRAQGDALRSRGAAYQLRIDAYREHQRQLAEQRQHARMLANHATRIQAWWRGVMVRHQLGRFRPNKKNKSGKKGGANKAKK